MEYVEASPMEEILTDGGNDMKVHRTLYILTTLLLVFAGFTNLAFLTDKEVRMLLTTPYFIVGKGGDYYFNPAHGILFALFVILLLFTFFVAMMMIFKGKAIQDKKLYDLAFSKTGRWTWFPVLIVCAIVFIPIDWNDVSEDTKEDPKKWRNFFAVALAFCMVSLIFFVWIYAMMEDCGDSILAFIYKKCFISTFIAYLYFYFFNTGIMLYIFIYYVKYDWDEPPDKPKEISSFVSMIIYGLGIGAGAWFWKDICLGLIGAFFEMGFLIRSAKDKEKGEDDDDRHSLPGARITGNLISSSIMMCLLFIEIFLILATKKKEVLK